MAQSSCSAATVIATLLVGTRDDLEPLVNNAPIAARLVNCALGCLFVLAVYGLARSYCERNSALLALSMCVFSPTITGLSAVAGTDIGVAAFGALSVLFLHFALEKGSLLWFVLTGLVCGLACAAKFSGFGIPVIVIILILLHKNRSWSHIFKASVAILLTCWLVFSSFYLFKGCFTHKPHLQDNQFKSAIGYFLPKQAIFDMRVVARKASQGWDVRLLGVTREKGAWWYYPAIFLLKTPLGTLLLILAAGWCILRDSSKRPVVLYNILLVFFLLITPIILFNRAQSGVRHLTIAYPYLYVAVAGLCISCIKNKYLSAVVAVAVCINLFSICLTYPFNLSLVNRIGSYLCDDIFIVYGPDIDWGQDEYFVAKRLSKLPQGVTLSVLPNPAERPVIGYVAISSERLRNSDWLRVFEPVEKMAGAWLLFHITEKKMNALGVSDNPRKEQAEVYLQWLLYSRQFSKTLSESKRLAQKERTLLFYAAKALVLLEDYESAYTMFNSMHDNKWAEMARNAFRGQQMAEKNLSARAAWQIIDLDSYWGPEVAERLIGKLLSEPENDDEALLAAMKSYLSGKQLKRANRTFKRLSSIPPYAESARRFEILSRRCVSGPSPTMLATNLFHRRGLPCNVESYKELCRLYLQDPDNFEIIRRLVMFQVFLRWRGHFDFGNKTHPLSKFECGSNTY